MCPTRINPPQTRLSRVRGFTLIELLVACALTGLLVALLGSIVSQTSGVWRTATNKIDSFQSARFGFETLTREISKATLNTYLAYDDPLAPTKYLRQSELRFKMGPGLVPGSVTDCIFFQAPTARTDLDLYRGLDGMLGSTGFFIAYVADEVPDDFKLKIARIPRSFRLMQWSQSGERLSVYDYPNSDAWFADAASEAKPIADNIIALILRPKFPDNQTPPAGWDSYVYDSGAGGASGVQPIKQHQLPPLVQITMVAIDREANTRLANVESDVKTALSGLFSADSDPESTFDNDLNTLKDNLTQKGIRYQTFTATIPLREGKWTK